MHEPTPQAIITAGLLVIGDEILSGRTKDRNIGHIAEYLTNVGIDLREVRVVPDVEDEIVGALNAIDISMEDHRRLIEPELLQQHPETGPIFRQRVIEQQAEFLRLLRFNGVEVLSPNPQAAAFCQVFTRDPCFAVGETLFLGSLRSVVRFGTRPRPADLARRIIDVFLKGAAVSGKSQRRIPQPSRD